MANDENAPKTVNEAVARILNLIVEGWTRDEKYGQRSPWQQFGLLWLGAMAFTWPLFTLHFGQVLKRQFSGSIDDKLWLSIAGLGISAVASAFPAWLAMTKRKGQTKVRLFLTGFLLPYVVVGLLLPLLQTNGSGP